MGTADRGEDRTQQTALAPALLYHSGVALAVGIEIRFHKRPGHAHSWGLGCASIGSREERSHRLCARLESQISPFRRCTECTNGSQ
eukprot:SAG31_NODE_18738_length_624_cov_1.472381_1_plen_85_part_10